MIAGAAVTPQAAWFHQLRLWLVRVLKYSFLSVYALFILLPLVFALLSSIRPAGEIFKYVSPFSLKSFVPQQVVFDAYYNLFMKYGFGRALWNTAAVAFLTVLFGILFNSIAGFAFVKFHFRGKSFWYGIVLFTMMIPFEAISIPLYEMIYNLQWINSLQALVIPAVANGLYIFLFKQFFEEIPESLSDSARIDGAGWFRIYWSIFVPLTKSVMLSASLLIFFFQWHSFVWPLLAANTRELMVIQVALSVFKQEHETLWGEMFAASVIATLLPLLFFFPLQKYYRIGITASGIKE
jgi:ABC-type glycerol-3-phosphate transport system permease component